MSARRVRANPGEGGRLRGQILDAADRLLVAAGGASALTLRAVAQEVGVTTPSVYRHFPDKATLVGAVCLRAWDQLTQRMQEAAQAFDDPFQGLGASGRAYVRFGVDHPVQYRLLLMGPGWRDSSVDHSAEDEAATICFRNVVLAVERCVADGSLVGDPETIAQSLWVTTHGLVTMLISTPPFPMAADPDALIETTLQAAGLGMAVLSRVPASRERLGELSPELLDQGVDALVTVLAGGDPAPSRR